QPNEEINLLIVKNGQLFFSRRLRGFAHIANKSEDELTMGIIDSLSLEIQRSTDYFERQLKQAPIKIIEILLPVEQEAFLASKLAENTNVEVKLFAMPETLENFRGSAVAIGATQLNFMEPNQGG
ncbi:MAG: MSHA biogenesis protein MshI, partial [Psychroserpens sp.]